MQKSEVTADELLSRAINISGLSSNFVRDIYKDIIFDFLTGQHDRHLDNLAIMRNRSTKKIKLYPLYDNGLRCFSHLERETAIELLTQGFYSYCYGTSEDIIEAIVKYRESIFNADLALLVNYKALNIRLIEQLLNKSSKYDKLGKQRTEAIAKFIMRQAYIIDCINYRKEIPQY